MEHPRTRNADHGTAGLPAAGDSARQDPSAAPDAPSRAPSSVHAAPAQRTASSGRAPTVGHPASSGAVLPAPPPAAAPAGAPAAGSAVPPAAAHARAPETRPQAASGYDPRAGSGFGSGGESETGSGDEPERGRQAASEQGPGAVSGQGPGAVSEHRPHAGPEQYAQVPHARYGLGGNEGGAGGASGARSLTAPEAGRAIAPLTAGDQPAPAPVPPQSADESPRGQVRRVSVRGQVLDALRAALLEGELVPGKVYSAPVLAERFGVSATPVREAMQQLACEGAVEVVPNRGFRVVCRDARELAELAEVRALIEVPVMLRLARGVPAGRWAEFRALAEAATVPAGRADRAGYVIADRAFHGALLGLAGNRQLVRTADDLHRRAQWPRVSGSSSCRRAGLLAHAAAHTELLDALAARDLALVESLVRDHFHTEC